MYTVTDRLYEAEVFQILDDLDGYGTALAEGPASAIATNIKLISTCMQALPDLLAGALPASCLCFDLSSLAQDLEEWLVFQECKIGMCININRHSMKAHSFRSNLTQPSWGAGRRRIADVMFPKGTPDLVEPIYKNPLLSAPFNEQLAAAIRAYALSMLQVYCRVHSHHLSVSHL